METFKKHPILHPNFPLLCFAMEAKDYHHEKTAGREYSCWFCGKRIMIGEQYMRLGKVKKAHADCAKEFAALAKKWEVEGE